MRSRRALDENVAVAPRVADGDLKVRLPRFRNPLQEGQEVGGPEHVHRRPPRLGVEAGQHERHVAAVGAADKAGPGDVKPLVARQHRGHGVDVAEAVLPAPARVGAPSSKRALEAEEQPSMVLAPGDRPGAGAALGQRLSRAHAQVDPEAVAHLRLAQLGGAAAEEFGVLQGDPGGSSG